MAHWTQQSGRGGSPLAKRERLEHDTTNGFGASTAAAPHMLQVPMLRSDDWAGGARMLHLHTINAGRAYEADPTAPLVPVGGAALGQQRQTASLTEDADILSAAVAAAAARAAYPAFEPAARQAPAAEAPERGQQPQPHMLPPARQHAWPPTAWHDSRKQGLPRPPSPSQTQHQSGTGGNDHDILATPMTTYNAILAGMQRPTLAEAWPAQADLGWDSSPGPGGSRPASLSGLAGRPAPRVPDAWFAGGTGGLPPQQQTPLGMTRERAIALLRDPQQHQQVLQQLQLHPQAPLEGLASSAGVAGAATGARPSAGCGGPTQRDIEAQPRLLSTADQQEAIGILLGRLIQQQQQQYHHQGQQEEQQEQQQRQPAQVATAHLGYAQAASYAHAQGREPAPLPRAAESLPELQPAQPGQQQQPVQLRRQGSLSLLQVWHPEQAGEAQPGQRPWLEHQLVPPQQSGQLLGVQHGQMQQAWHQPCSDARRLQPRLDQPLSPHDHHHHNQQQQQHQQLHPHPHSHPQLPHHLVHQTQQHRLVLRPIYQAQAPYMDGAEGEDVLQLEQLDYELGLGRGPDAPGLAAPQAPALAPALAPAVGQSVHLDRKPAPEASDPLLLDPRGAAAWPAGAEPWEAIGAEPWEAPTGGAGIGGGPPAWDDAMAALAFIARSSEEDDAHGSVSGGGTAGGARGGGGAGGRRAQQHQTESGRSAGTEPRPAASSGGGGGGGSSASGKQRGRKRRQRYRSIMELVRVMPTVTVEEALAGVGVTPIMDAATLGAAAPAAPGRRSAA